MNSPKLHLSPSCKKLAKWDHRGRYVRRNKRATADNSLILDVSTFSKLVNLSLPRRGDWYWKRGSAVTANIGYEILPNYGVRLFYKQAGQSFDYVVRTVTTDCHYGGARPWFICPNEHCQKRVRILHLNRYFVCRKCAERNYYDCQQNKDMIARIDGEIQRIQRKLGGEELHVEAPAPDKPKGMHFDTYVRITERLWVLQECRCLAWLIELTKMVHSSGQTTGRSVEGMTEQLRWLLKQTNPFTLNMKNWLIF